MQRLEPEVIIHVEPPLKLSSGGVVKRVFANFKRKSFLNRNSVLTPRSAESVVRRLSQRLHTIPAFRPVYEKPDAQREHRVIASA
jgi:hypothetical protein